MEPKSKTYSIWVEAEHWAPGQWTPTDDNSDVIVTFENGERWVATFFSYQNIHSLREKNHQTGECLGGKYFQASDMILADVITRECIEEIVVHLLEEQTFGACFSRCPDRSEEQG